jgi:hypothetical protein
LKKKIIVFLEQEGLAPLHVAVKARHEDVCRTILSFKGQVDIEDSNLKQVHSFFLFFFVALLTP